MVISSFANEKRRKGFFLFGCIGFSLFRCVLVFTYVRVYSRYALCLFLQILLVAALDIKTRDVPSVSSIKSLLSQYLKASHFFFANFYVRGGGAPTVRFAPVVPWAKTGPEYTLFYVTQANKNLNLKVQTLCLNL
jgi:hypothetical protein